MNAYDRDTPEDLRTMREFVKLGSTINQGVHYSKPMANSLLVMECSAMPAKVKRTTLTQEIIRIHKNIRTPKGTCI